MPEVLFFKNRDALKKWYLKNHNKIDSQWIGLYKKTAKKDTLLVADASELALSFGWTGVVIKRIDLWTYKIKFMRRKPGSIWGNVMIKRFGELKARGLVHKAGQKAFDERDKKKSEEKIKAMSTQQLKLFKANKAAWAFFQTQTESYRKYMVYWVTNAKRPETREKRLNELITDSANGTKLKRILAAIEKTKPKYEEGKTPIEAGRNLGPSIGADFRSVGVETLEQLQRIGWERALNKVCEIYPHRLNLNFFYAAIGAVEDQDGKKLDTDLKEQAKELLYQLKHR